MSLVDKISNTNEFLLAANKGNNKKEVLKETFAQLVQDKQTEYFTRIQNGSYEQSFQIGAGSYTEAEWKKLLKNFDAAEEQLCEAAEETEKKEQETGGSQVADLIG